MNTIKYLKNLEHTFDFSYLDQNHERFSQNNKKKIGKTQVEFPENIGIDEFVCLRSKAFSFKFKDDKENENELKGISKVQPKHIKFQEYKNFLY